MHFTDLPSELRSRIYNLWFSGRTFRPARSCLFTPSRKRQPDEVYLSNAFLICKFISYDPWLAQAIVRQSIFHIDGFEDLRFLQHRFGTDDLRYITQLGLSSNMSKDTAIFQIQSLMPKLNRIRMKGDLSPLYYVWDYRLEGFDTHPWAKFVACLCVFASGRTPGPDSVLTDLSIAGQMELLVDFVWDEDGVGTRRMQLSTKDWLLTYEIQGKQYAVKQVRPKELRVALLEAKCL